jgi:hypothetical protein
LDREFARDATGYVLLQVRPALFPLQRNPTLSLANHEEILPAIVNGTGVFHRVWNGARLRLDGARGQVELFDGPFPGAESRSSLGK